MSLRTSQIMFKQFHIGFVCCVFSIYIHKQLPRGVVRKEMKGRSQMEKHRVEAGAPPDSTNTKTTVTKDA